MIKVLFIILGFVCLVFAFWRFISPNKNKCDDKNIDIKTLNVVECSYCGDYVEKEPVCKKVGLCLYKR